MLFRNGQVMRRKKYAQKMFDEKQLKYSFYINLLETYPIYRIQYRII